MRYLLSILVLAGGRLAADSIAYFPAGQALALQQAGGGARAMALGSAAVAIEDPDSALYWNPAGLAGAEGNRIALHHNTWLAGVVQESLAETYPIAGLGVLGFSQNYVDFGSFESRDDQGRLGMGFSASRLGLGLGWARRFSNALDLGVGIKGARETLADQQYNAFSTDLGLAYSPMPGLRLAAAFNNLGNQVGGNAQASGLFVGAALHHDLGQALAVNLAAGSAIEPQGVDRLQLGAELSILRSLCLRGGYLLNFQDNSAASLDGLTLGAGFSYRSLQVDFAWLSLGDLGSSQRVSLAWHFAPPLAEAAEALKQPPPSPKPQAPQIHFQVLSDGYTQGRELQSAGKFAEALAAYRKAIAADGQDLESWKGMAEIYDQLGKKDYARQCYREVLKQAPDDKDAAPWK
jgi:tetratricopeptide (TPR) repeat protein